MQRDISVCVLPLSCNDCFYFFVKFIISIFSQLKMSSKRRKYLDSYLEMGFTYVTDKGDIKPQCVICSTVLSSESMKPSKLKRHFETNHPQYSYKDSSTFKTMGNSLKKRRFDACGEHQQTSKAVTQASFEIAQHIAKQKKPHTIGENLIKACLKRAVKVVLGEESANKIDKIPLSNNTVKDRITRMSADIKEKVIVEISTSPLFAIQLDESTDVASCSQLLVFVRYICEDDLIEEFLFCSDLEQTTTGQDVLEKIDDVFDSSGLEWEKMCGVCTDGAPAMLGSKSGFQTRVKEKAPNAKGTHCMIHRYALASKTLPVPLQDVLSSVIKIVNFVKGSALQTRLFKQLCKEMGSEHESLLFYTQVRWLSNGNVLRRVFEMREEIQLFLEIQGKQNL